MLAILINLDLNCAYILWSIPLHFNLVIILGQEFGFVWYKFNLTITICYNFSYAFCNTKFPYKIKTIVYLINQTFHSWIIFKASPIRTKKDFHESFHSPSSTSTVENVPCSHQLTQMIIRLPHIVLLDVDHQREIKACNLLQIKFSLHLGKQKIL